MPVSPNKPLSLIPILASLTEKLHDNISNYKRECRLIFGVGTLESLEKLLGEGQCIRHKTWEHFELNNAQVWLYNSRKLFAADGQLMKEFCPVTETV